MENQTHNGVTHDDELEISLYDICVAIFRKKFMIAFFIIVALALAVGYLFVVREAFAVGGFGHAVLQAGVVVVELAVVSFDAELRGGAVHGDAHVVARAVACLPDGLDDAVQRILHAVQLGRKAAFVAHGGAQAACLQYLLQGMEHLGPHAQPLAEGGSAHGAYHEFLESNGRVAMSTAVDDVHHGDRHHVGVCPADVAV